MYLRISLERHGNKYKKQAFIELNNLCFDRSSLFVEWQDGQRLRIDRVSRRSV